MKVTKMNLRLFGISVNKTTDAGLSPENKTYYEKVLLESTKPNLVHNQFGQKRSIPKRGGKSIEWRKFSSLPKAINPLTEGVTPEGKNYTVNSVTANVNQYGDYVGITDIVDMTAIDNNALEVTKMLGDQAGLTLDAVTRTAILAGTNRLLPTGADGQELTRGALNKDYLLTVDLVYKAVNRLKRMNVPTIDGYYIAIIHPDCTLDLMRSEEWIEAHKYASPENIYEGEVGKIAKCRFVESSEAGILTSKTASNCPEGLAIYPTIFLGKDAYGVVDIEGGGLEHIMKPLGAGDDPLNQRATIGWKATAAAKILAEERIVRVETCSSNSDKASSNL